MALSEAQCIMLNEIVYAGDYIREGDTLRDVVSRIKKEVESGNLTNWFMMDRESMDRFISSVEKSMETDPGFGNLVAYDVKHASSEYAGTIATFYNSANKKECYVVSAGTTGPFEPGEDIYGAIVADTSGQKELLHYVENLPKEFGDDIVVTGHSKGGNESMYAAILSTRVGQCVSIDGQGFSNEFCEKYTELIEKNKYKITNICCSHDYVNQLLHSIAGKTVYITPYSYEKDSFIYWHRPDILLDEYGNLMKPCVSPAIGRTLIGLFSRFLADVDPGLLTYFFAGLVTGVLIGFETIKEICEAFGNWLAEVGKSIENTNINIVGDVNKAIETITLFQNQTAAGSNVYYSANEYGSIYSQNNPEIEIDTDALCYYRDRLLDIQRNKIPELNNAIKRMYGKSGVSNTVWIQHADIKANPDDKLESCAAYLNQVADDFLKAELKIRNFFK